MQNIHVLGSSTERRQIISIPSGNSAHKQETSHIALRWLNYFLFKCITDSENYCELMMNCYVSNHILLLYT